MPGNAPQDFKTARVKWTHDSQEPTKLNFQEDMKMEKLLIKYGTQILYKALRAAFPGWPLW